MFKKAIIASAVMAASVSAVSATWAPEWDTTAAVVGTEGITGVLDSVGVKATSGGVVRLGTQYYVGDLVTFTYSTPVASANVFPTVFKSATSGTAIGLWQTTTCASTTACVLETTNGADNIGDAIGAGVINVGDRFLFTGSTTVHTVITKPAAAGSITFSPAAATTPNDDVAVTIQGYDVIEFGKQSETANSVTYRVGSFAQHANANGRLNTRVGSLVPAPEVTLTAAGILAGSAATNVKFSSTTAAGVALETISTGKNIISSVSENPITITKFDAVIDVAQDNKGFVGGTSVASSDVLTFTFTPETTTAVGTNIDSTSTLGLLTAEAGVTAATWNTQSTVHTVTGDFGFMDDAATAGVTSSDIVASAGTVALATTGASFTVTDTGMATKTVTVTKDIAAAVIPVQSMTGTSVISYKNNSNIAQTSTITHAALGGFTLNGATVKAYGVPMGSTVSRFIWISNKGATGAIASVTVEAEGTSYGPYAIGTIGAKKTTSFATAIDAALTTAGVVLPDNSRATITITSPIAQANIEMSAAYKHIADADRLTIETSDSLN